MQQPEDYNSISHFLNHAQKNEVMVSVAGSHGFVKHDRLDEESEKINNHRERINNKTSKVSQNIAIRDCGHQQTLSLLTGRQSAEFEVRRYENLIHLL